MPSFRKKPVVIEAFRVFMDLEAPDWFVNAINTGKIVYSPGISSKSPGGPHYRIETLEGVMTANPGDWIIKGVKDELYPCKHEIFLATYEAMDEVADV